MVSTKDRTWKEKQCGVVYSVKCGGCEKEYIGEIARTLGVRFKNTPMANIPTLPSHNTPPPQATSTLWLM